MGRAIGRKGTLYFDTEEMSRRAAVFEAETDRTRGWCYANAFGVELTEAEMDAVGRHFYLGGLGCELPPAWQHSKTECSHGGHGENGNLLTLDSQKVKTNWKGRRLNNPDRGHRAKRKDIE